MRSTVNSSQVSRMFPCADFLRIMYVFVRAPTTTPCSSGEIYRRRGFLHARRWLNEGFQLNICLYSRHALLATTFDAALVGIHEAAQLETQGKLRPRKGECPLVTDGVQG